MKLRIINNGDLFFPQYAKKGTWGTRWAGFGTPPVKFSEERDALTFVKLVGKAILPDSRLTSPSIVWKNFKEKPKKVR